MDTNNSLYLENDQPDSLPELKVMLADLAQARLNLEWGKKGMDNYLQAARENPEYVAYEKANEIAKMIIENTTRRIKEYAMAEYQALGHKVMDGSNDNVKVAVGKILEYNQEDAIAWCIENMPEALKLNEQLFEKHAKAVSETQPLSFVKIGENPVVKIATDLSEFLGDKK